MESENLKSSFYVITKPHKNNERLTKIMLKQLNPTDPTPLNRYELQNFAYYGFSDKLLRPKLWKIFLWYYPENKFKYENFIKEKRNSYNEYKEMTKEKLPYDNIITDDVNRTLLFPVQIDGEMQCKFLDSAYNDERSHRDVVKDILHVFKMTNPAVEYVQGMNMLILVIYFVFATSNENDNVEVETFFCFLNLITEIGEHFVERMDDKYCGIAQKLHRVLDIVKMFDKELYDNMATKNLTNNIFHFRWIMLSFAQEFPINEVVWLWDKLLSDNTRFELVLYCAAAKILLLKKRIMENDFATCMEIFQGNEEVDVYSMFYKADEMRRNVYKDG